jgi:hypothetical protein
MHLLRDFYQLDLYGTFQAGCVTRSPLTLT